MPSRLAFLVVSLLIGFPAFAFCEPEKTPEGAVRESRLFTEFKDNYFITGNPWNSGTQEGAVRFQFSIKANLIPTTSPCTLFFTYTQKSLWDLWNFSGSSPFIDSNYNPGGFVAWRRVDTPFLIKDSSEQWLTLLSAYLGFEHESNGRAGPPSRGWNRITAIARWGHFWKDGWQLALEPEVWLPFIDGRDPDGGGNPDLLTYAGYGQLTVDVGRIELVEDAGVNLMMRSWSLTAMVRPGDFSHALLEASARYRIPIVPASPLSGFFQCSLGYGEVMLTYNQRHYSCRLGLAIDDRTILDVIGVR